jgi:two-component system chemotaxis response regulator CheB
VIEQELAEKVAMVRQLSPAGRDGRRRMGPRTIAPGAAASFAQAAGRMQMAPAGTDREGGLSRLVVIGASTGGPSALVEVFSQFRPGANAAVVVAQHMPERFTKTFAERLNKLGGLKVSEARDFEPLHPGRAVLCPGGKCLEIVTFGHGYAASVVDPSPHDRFVPSVDRLFKSAAEVAGDKVVGVVLTGMGDDGACGVVTIRARGGMVLAESQETAVIYGMPGAAVRTGEVNQTLPLSALAAQVAELIV